MLMNNLDPEVAEHPDRLVVYGGTGRAARSWEAFEAIVDTLRELENDETLLVQSGKPVGVFRTHQHAPRVLIANSNLVGRWATWDHFNELDKKGINVKIVAAISPQLFRLQDDAYRERVASKADRWDAMVISNRSLRVTRDWVSNPVVAEYSLTSDWDDRWRTGGTVDEVVAEAHLSPEHILEGIERFAREREQRIGRLRELVDAAERHDG